MELWCLSNAGRFEKKRGQGEWMARRGKEDVRGGCIMGKGGKNGERRRWKEVGEKRWERQLVIP